jgi:RNA polymerase sigma-70 factor, ECF subfamily
MPDIQEFNFEQTLVELLDRLYAAALRLTRQADDAEDLVSETVARALARRTGLRDPASMHCWIFRIMTNTFISTCRSKKSRAETSLVDAEGDDEADFWLFDRLHQPLLMFAGSNPEQEFLSQILREDLDRALNSLTDEHRLIVLLADVEDFSYPEIAAMLDIPVGTVRSRLARARSRMQKLLWQQALDSGLATTAAEC